jgi:hypothetical protein
MLQILSAVFAAPVSEVLEEDVGRPVEEDKRALNELG